MADLRQGSFFYSAGKAFTKFGFFSSGIYFSYMYMPGRENAIVEDSKISGYLLNLQHPDGKGKANFFLKAGFHLDKIADFKAFLLNHAMTHQVIKAEQTRFGTKYNIEGEVELPDSFRFHLRTVWIVPHNTGQPKLITAYPLTL